MDDPAKLRPAVLGILQFMDRGADLTWLTLD